MNEELLKAINAGLGEGSSTTPAEDTTDDTDDTTTPDGGEGDTETGDDASNAGDAEGTSDDAGEGDGTGADVDGTGNPQKSGTAPEAAGKPGEKGAKPADPATDPAKAAAPKVIDPINDPIDPRLKEGTRERITKLVDIAKTKTEEAQTYKQNFEELYGTIEETRSTPEQFGQALSYLKMVNSNDPAQIEKALDFMMKEAQALSRMLGKPLPGMDLLGEHADLKAEVDAGRLNRDVAQELAATRNAQKFHRERHQQTQTIQQQEQQRQQELRTGIQSLNQLEATLKTDPNFAYKRQIVVEQLKAVMPNIHPSKWAATFKNAWDKLPAPQAPSPPPKSTVPAAQPMRARNPAGSQTPAPKSLGDAINQIDFGSIR